MQDYYLESDSKIKYELNKILISIGSSSEIKIDETEIPQILPRHCSLIANGMNWGRMICNLSESNPILVNNEIVQFEKKLKIGDKINVCGKIFTFLKKEKNSNKMYKTQQKQNKKNSLEINKEEEMKPKKNEKIEMNFEFLDDENFKNEKISIKTKSILQPKNEIVFKSDPQIFYNISEDDDNIMILDDDEEEEIKENSSIYTSPNITLMNNSIYFNESEEDNKPFEF